MYVFISNQIKSNQILFKVGNVHLKEKKPLQEAHTFIFMYVLLFVCVYMYVWTYGYVSVYVYMCVCVYGNAYMHVRGMCG